jgi:hypothetical protein
MSTTNNPMDLPNVHAPESKEAVGGYRVTPSMAEVIWELALKNPMWTFKGDKFSWVDNSTRIGPKTMVLAGFTISQSWEKLGAIERTYLTRKGSYGFEITNHRLDTRNNNYRTEDAAKAVAKIRKTFKPRSVLEIATESDEKAEALVRAEKHSKDRAVRRHMEEIKQKAIDYVTKGPGYNLFLEYAKQQGDKSVHNSLEMLQIATDELSTIEGIKDAMGAKKSALIVVDEGKYLVKINDNVQLYDDTTLPTEFRGKLGLLKLVNEQQFVTDVGCRVNKEIYVLKLDEQTEEPK